MTTTPCQWLNIFFERPTLTHLFCIHHRQLWAHCEGRSTIMMIQPRQCVQKREVKPSEHRQAKLAQSWGLLDDCVPVFVARGGQAEFIGGVLIRTERGCPHPQHPKLEPVVKCFKGLAIAIRGGWDSRAPKNCKLGHRQFIIDFAQISVAMETVAHEKFSPARGRSPTGKH